MEIKNLTNLTEKRRLCALISNYEPPLVDVIEVSVEKGFADSATDFEEDIW